MTDPEAYWESNEEEADADAKAMGGIMQLIDDRVLVRPRDPNEVTDSGIVIPANARERSREGVVVVVGPGMRVPFLVDGKFGARAALPIGVGDVVLHASYGSTEYEIDGVKHLILREHEIMAVLEKGPCGETFLSRGGDSAARCTLRRAHDGLCSAS